MQSEEDRDHDEEKGLSMAEKLQCDFKWREGLFLHERLEARSDSISYKPQNEEHSNTNGTSYDPRQKRVSIKLIIHLSTPKGYLPVEPLTISGQKFGQLICHIL